MPSLFQSAISGLSPAAPNVDDEFRIAVAVAIDQPLAVAEHHRMPGAVAANVGEERDVTGLPERHAQVGDEVVVAIDEEAADAGTIDADRRLQRLRQRVDRGGRAAEGQHGQRECAGDWRCEVVRRSA